jgi:hypothetical protein
VRTGLAFDIAAFAPGAARPQFLLKNVSTIENYCLLSLVWWYIALVVHLHELCQDANRHYSLRWFRAPWTC